jgi:hypothetical protein
MSNTQLTDEDAPDPMGRHEQIEKRSVHAGTILATMAAVSAIVCHFASPIPEMLLHAAVGTLIGGVIGTVVFVIVLLYCNARR